MDRALTHTPPSQPAPKSRRAVIDIGTNSVKLLVADIADTCVTPVFEDGVQTRLGRGFYEHRRLQPDAIAQTAQTVAAFVRAAQCRQPHSIRIVATSAAREAVNRQELIDSVRLACGREPELLSGQQEADLIFAGAQAALPDPNETVLVVDLGGGSTEFVLGRQGHAIFGRSFELGTVRLHEAVKPADPPTHEDRRRCTSILDRILQDAVLPDIKPALAKLAQTPLLLGTGGTASVLASIHHGLLEFDRARIESTVLDRASVEAMRDRLWQTGLAERRAIPGVPADRADIVLMGLTIYAGVMGRLGLKSARISTGGLRFALLLDPPAS